MFSADRSKELVCSRASFQSLQGNR